MLATAIEHLRTISTDTPTDVAFFYCSFVDLASQNLANILGSLLFQLTATRPSLMDRLGSLYNDSRNQSDGVSIDALTTVFQESLLEEQDRITYLIVDAMNEAGEQTSAALAGIITDLVKQAASSGTSLRVILSSTHHYAQEHEAETNTKFHLREVYMQGNLVNTDVQVFVDDRLSKQSQFRHIKGKAREEMREAVLSRADGM